MRWINEQSPDGRHCANQRTGQPTQTEQLQCTDQLIQTDQHADRSKGGPGADQWVHVTSMRHASKSSRPGLFRNNVGTLIVTAIRVGAGERCSLMVGALGSPRRTWPGPGSIHRDGSESATITSCYISAIFRAWGRQVACCADGRSRPTVTAPTGKPEVPAVYTAHPHDRPTSTVSVL